jgi:hypothetical protein
VWYYKAYRQVIVSVALQETLCASDGAPLQKVTAMDVLTSDEQEILDGLFVKSQLPGYDPMLDTTEEERRIAAKYIVICLQQLAALGIRSQIVIAGDND